MAVSRTILISGAGIGGLAAALALAAQDFRIVVIEQAERLEEIGAGLQLSPNATHVLLALGLGDRLKDKIVAPETLRIRSGWSGEALVEVPLGARMEFRFGAPYWLAHRGDLHAALLAAARENPDIVIRTGWRVTDFALHRHGVTVDMQRGAQAMQERGVALIGADGLWSSLRDRLRDDTKPRFRHRSAWRALLPASDVLPEFRTADVNLWLGANAHLVHYPVSGGALINVVAIINDDWSGREWNAAGKPADLLPHFAKWRWSRAARALLEAPQSWAKWALYDRPIRRLWGKGAMTLLGDAAHPMLPFLGQGAAMAIEDAAVLASCLAADRDEPARAMRRYEGLRRGRVARVQWAARQTGRLYHMAGALALSRNFALRQLGGERLRNRYDWIYDWRVR